MKYSLGNHWFRLWAVECKSNIDNDNDKNNYKATVFIFVYSDDWCELT